MSWITEKPEGVVITIFVQPRASKNMIAGLHGDALKIKLTAPPVDNAANKMCVQFLAKCLDISKSSLEIISGQTSRTKQILVRDANGGKILKEKIESLLV
jgi:hypothetical protein